MRGVQVDAAVFGAGIAGLWLTARLLAAGYRVLLLESAAIGAGQTRCAQGIIHGGAKYALTGQLSAAARQIGAMPGRWREALAGRGELDLSAVRVLAPQQWLWPAGGLPSRLAGFFASHVMQSRMARLEAGAVPTAFAALGVEAPVYQLDEPVLDVASLLVALTVLCRPALCHTRAAPVDWREAADAVHFTLPLPQGGVSVTARRAIFTAGEGNERLGPSPPAAQRRPLHMVLVRGALPPLYGHAIEADALPRLTLTTHRAADGAAVWYLGGRLAESGVGLDSAAQCARARSELAALFPRLDSAALRCASFQIDRAEPVMPGGARPDRCQVLEQGARLHAWPVKLAFAPLLADEVLARLPPAAAEGGDWPAWPMPVQAPMPWNDEALPWS
jgi:glycine/D-amino acid oxidase-like deaminating enzyme